MKPCCKETYKKVLQEVVLTIRRHPGKSIASIIMSLEYAILMLEQEIECGEIIFDEWRDK